MMINLPLGINRIAKQNNLLIISFALLLGLIFGQVNCSTFAQNRKIELNENFTLQIGETVETKDSKLKVRLITTGREIYKTGEIEYAELQLISDKSEQKLRISEAGNRKREVGDFIIEIINAESFGNGGCELKISTQSINETKK